MREIKFRAWDKINKTMYHDIHKLDSLAEKISRPNEYEIMQFTGLLDKSGKEIYEGDIVRAIYPNIEINRIADLDQTFVVGWENRYPHDSFLGYNFGLFDSIEIIGNIWENGGLLNATNKTETD